MYIMDKLYFVPKKSNFRSAYSGGGDRNGEAGSGSMVGVRGVYYYDGRLEEKDLVSGGNAPKYNLKEPFDPMVRTCKDNKRLVR